MTTNRSHSVSPIYMSGQVSKESVLQVMRAVCMSVYTNMEGIMGVPQ